MPYCVAIGCSNKSGSKSKAQLELEKHAKITFHRFPKKVDIRKVWIDKMRLTEASLPKEPCLCSRHFSSKSFDRTSAYKTRLKDFAVPSLNNVQDVSQPATNRNTEALQKISNTNVENVVDEETIKLEYPSENEAFTMDEAKEPARKIQKTDFSPTDVCERIDASSQTLSQPISADKATWVSKSFIANSPTAILLRGIIKNQKDSYEKKIKLLKRASQRKDKRIAILKNELTDLKKQNRKPR